MSFLNQIKLSHWVSRSYSEHKALDKLHSDMSEHIDKLIETSMGNSENQQIVCEINTSISSNINILKYLINRYNFLKKYRNTIKPTELQNIIDEMLTDINQAIYLLRLT